MSKHTPGPWEIRREKNGYIIGIWVPNSVNPNNEPGKGGTIVIDGCPCGNSNANAALIAAAPDLLEACRAILMGLGMNGGQMAANDPELVAARAAIAKAEAQGK